MGSKKRLGDRRRLAVVVLLLTGGGGVLAHLWPEPSASDRPQRPVMAGQRAFMDPESGKLVAPPGRLPHDASRFLGDTSDMAVEHRDGMTFVHLPKKPLWHLHATLDASGRVHFSHEAADD